MVYTRSELARLTSDINRMNYSSRAFSGLFPLASEAYFNMIYGIYQFRNNKDQKGLNKNEGYL